MPEGRTGDRVDTVSLPGLCSGTAVVSAGVTVLQHRDKSFESTLPTGHFDIPGNEWTLFFFSQAHLEHCLIKDQKAQSEKQ